MSTQVQTEFFSWEDLVEENDPRPTHEIVYEFSNGRHFVVPFNEDGYGIYDND